MTTSVENPGIGFRTDMITTVARGTRMLAEENPSRFVKDAIAKRVIDTSTGAYLEIGEGGGPEQIRGFVIVDGSTRIFISTTREDRVEDKNLFLRYIFPYGAGFQGRPLRTGYLDLVESLIVAYGDGFKGWSTKGYSVRTDISFTDRFIKSVEDWERSNG